MPNNPNKLKLRTTLSDYLQTLILLSYPITKICLGIALDKQLRFRAHNAPHLANLNRQEIRDVKWRSQSS